jgi:hypothetical protein
VDGVRHAGVLLVRMETCMKDRPRSFQRRLGVWLTTIVMAVGVGAVATAAPAMAAGCFDTGCNGWDPSYMGCDVGAITLESFTPQASAYALVELRYSSTCNTGWTRYTTGAPADPRYKYLRLQIWNAPSGGSMGYFSVFIDGTAKSGDRLWTPMWSMSQWLQACVKDSTGDGPCTARH